MSSSTCPQCATVLEPDAVLCPKCDLILDTSFLGGDILDSAMGEAQPAPPVDDESYVSLFAEETGGFLTSPTSEMSRSVFPLAASQPASIQGLLEDASVVEQTGHLAPGALSDVERFVLSLANAERPVARIRTLVLEEMSHTVAADVRGALVSLAEKGLVRQSGVARAPTATDENEGPTRALSFPDDVTQALPSEGETAAFEGDIDQSAPSAPPSDRPAFEADEGTPPDWLDGPTNLDLRGAGLDEGDLISSSEEDSDLDGASVGSIAASRQEEPDESEFDGIEVSLSDTDDSAEAPKVESMVFETNAAFSPSPPSIGDMSTPPPAQNPFMSAEADAIFATASPEAGFGGEPSNTDASVVDAPADPSLDLAVDSSIGSPLDFGLDASDLAPDTDDGADSLAADSQDQSDASAGFDDDAEVTRGDVEGAIAYAARSEERAEFTQQASDPEGTALLSSSTPSTPPPPSDDAAAPAEPKPGESVAEQAERAFRLAMNDLKEGRKGRAKSFLRVAQKLVPSSPLYAAVGEHWDQVVARAAEGFDDPLPQEMLLFIQAQEQDAQHNVDAALALVTKAITVAPDNAQLHNYLGVLYAGRKQDAASALKPLMRAVELAPDHADFRHNLTRVLAMGQPKDAAPLPQAQRLGDVD